MTAAYAHVKRNAPQSREAVILEHYPKVRKIALRMARRFHSSVDVDELIQVGTLGLIEAVDRYEPKHNASLGTYAKIRIQGSILDFMRQNDWVPRSVRARSNMLKEVQKDLKKTLKRSPEHGEIAKKMNVSKERLNTIIRFSEIRTILSFEQGTADEKRLGDTIPSNGIDPQEQSIIREETRLLQKMIGSLEPRQRQIFELYYNKDMTQSEIAEILGVTESRICQINVQIKKKFQRMVSSQYR